MSVPIDLILVPQGAEYNSICRGLRLVKGFHPQVLAIPMGFQPLTQYLEKVFTAEYLANSGPLQVLLVGLCGSLTPLYSLRDVVLYQECVYQSELGLQQQTCDRTLTSLLQEKLPKPVSLVKSLTSDRLIFLASEKQQLCQKYALDVVDMEGFAALDFFNKHHIAVAMVRVVSDDSKHNLPDLSAAINPDGILQPIPLAIGMIRQPLAAIRLIYGSLKGLKVLEKTIMEIYHHHHLEDR